MIPEDEEKELTFKYKAWGGVPHNLCQSVSKKPSLVLYK